MRKIALLNQKGGVSKTTTAFALAKGLQGNVLSVDADPQSNLSFAFGVTDAEYTLQDVFEGLNPDEAIIKGLNLICGDLRLSDADMRYTSVNRAYILQEALEKVQGNYDYAIIDCPPILGVLSMNALTAADEIIIPISVDAFSLQGVTQLNDFIENIRKYCNSDLKISGILRTKYNKRLNITSALDDEIQAAAEKMGTKVFNTCISESVAIRESQMLQTDFFTEAPQAAAVIDYKAFIEEFLRG